MKDLIIKQLKEMQISYSSAFLEWLDNVNDNILETIMFTLTNLMNFDGIQDHINSISNVIDLSNDNEREIRNRIAELIACRFIKNVLGYEIAKIESSKTSIYSPYRNKDKKSCDILAIAGTIEHYFEVKDSSTEIMSRKDYGDHIGYKPATRPYLEEWLYWKINESIEKGATDLFAIVPFWVNPLKDNHKDFFSSWIYSICMTHFKLVEQTDANQYKLRIDLKIPDFFKRIILPNRGRHFELVLVNE